jgi:hypothetical protein
MKNLGTVVGLLLSLAAGNVHPQSATTYYACVRKDGTLRIVSPTTTCEKNETRIHWNQTGPAGPGLESGQIIGQVVGCSAMPVSQTVVHIRGRSIMARPDSAGQFELSYVPSGTHDVAIDLNSQSVRTLTGVTVSSGQLSDLGILDICATEACTPGETRPCARQEGVCSASLRTCPAHGAWAADCDYASFVADYSPVEKCDGKDNNCDGLVDEDFPNLGKQCFALSAGVCQAGVYVCSTTGGMTCSAGALPCPP